MSDELQRLYALEKRRAVLIEKSRKLDDVLRTMEEGDQHRRFVAGRKMECLNELTSINCEIKEMNRVISGPPGLARELLFRVLPILDDLDDLDADEFQLREQVRMFLNPSKVG